jgi:hypothetical protein
MYDDDDDDASYISINQSINQSIIFIDTYIKLMKSPTTTKWIDYVWIMM